MLRKRFLSVIIALAMVISVIPMSAYAEDTLPAVKIIGTTIKNDKQFFELTLHVTPGSKGFSVLGTVLQYDPTVISPAAWDTEGTAVPVPESTGWTNIAAVPAVCPTGIAGKTAFAYQNSGTGYIYLSSESSLPLTDLPNSGRILTVRFRYVGQNDTEIAQSKAKIENDFANVVKAAPDAVATASHAGYVVYYSTGDADLTEYMYNADATGIESASLLTAPAFELEKDGETANAGGAKTANNQALVFFDWDESTLLGSMVIDASQEQSEILATVNGFTASLLPNDADMSLWSTADAAHERYVAAKAAADEAADPESPNNGNYEALAAAAEEAKTAEQTALDALKAYDFYDTSKPLTSHNGYTFGKWVEYDSDAFTVYGDAVDVSLSTTMVQIDIPDSPSFDNISNGLVLKAAYMANQKLSTLGTNTEREYTISNDPAYDKGYIIRYASTKDIYTLKFDITRINAGNQPVHRPRITALKVIYNIEDDSGFSSSINSLVNLENKDIQSVEVSVPGNLTNVEVAVIDIGGINDWAGGSAVRSPLYKINTGKTSDDDLGYKILGTIQWINTHVASQSAMAKTVFDDAGLTGVTTALANRRTATTRIKKGLTDKRADLGLDSTEPVYLSQSEMQKCISSNSYK